ncbi:inovirus-type Gp2 protein [Vibrio europaeus]|uniref:YagK/YfjJ domain-containing protein n=1 Tax=Vibrio europaeus TaxID=300876 RepID=UPI0039E1029F
MKSISKKNIWKYKGHIISIPNGYLGWYPKILKTLAIQVDVALQSLKSIVVTRFEVFVKEFTKNNAVISHLTRVIKSHFARSFENLVVGYLWVREQGLQERQHYHWVLFVDGKRVSPRRLKEMLMELSNRLAFYTFSLTKNGRFIVKNVGDKQFKSLLKRASYLAKTRTKDKKTIGAHDYGASRLRIVSKST